MSISNIDKVLETVDEYKASAVVRTFVAYLLARKVDPVLIRDAWHATVKARIPCQTESQDDQMMRAMVRMAESSPDVQEIVKGGSFR